MLVPSSRLVWWMVLATVSSLGVLMLPPAELALLALDVVLVSAALIDWWLTPGTAAVEVLRLAPDRLSVLREHAITIQVRNRARVALSVRLRDTWPVSFQGVPEELSGTVPAQGEVRWEYQVTPRARGQFSWGSISLRYRSLLGLWERQKVVVVPAEVRVYPNLPSLSRYHLLARADPLQTLGIRKVRMRGGAWEFESLRDYVQGDDVRLLDWKATARRRKPIVRNQEAERHQTLLLLVDCGRLMNADVDGVAKLDHAVNSALLLAHVALGRGDRVGLCTFSHKVHAWKAPRGGRGQIRLLTETLYDLRGDFTETDHGRCLRLVAARHPKRSLLIVLTDFVDAQTAAEMLAHLQLTARRHVVLFAALTDPFLTRAARCQPHTAQEGFRKTTAIELLRERREVLERLRQMGAHVLDVEPSDLTPPLVNRYLEITFRGLL
ncbi:MAG: DUF58 domain-containing protein [Gemmataceae bacterium]|nr:DUF58 domain-containing protein [Gemmataceae bacterium]